MQYEVIFNKAADLRTLAQRLVEAAAGKDEQLVIQYVAEADTLMSTIVTEVELELPRFAVDSDPLNNQDDRERVARDMLDQYHQLRVKHKIIESITTRINNRLGPTHTMALDAQRRFTEVSNELEALIWTIIELMGVDS